MNMVEYDRPFSHRYTHYPSQPRDPHFQHLDHHSAPSTPPCQYAPLPSYSQQQQSNSVRSTPTSYPSPASYHSPQISTYNFNPQQSHYSSHSHSMAISNYLPPMRMTPPTTSLPAPVLPQPSSLQTPHHVYFGPPPPPPPITHITSSSHQPLRYALPQVPVPPEQRVMSGGRHKKEIKRRTKTGCLTCRKRRIKCDEAHPTCKNCAKSKRDCMGYDPIFKAQPGPAAIQPAPSSGAPAAVSSSTPVPYGIPGATVGNTVYAPQISTAVSSPASSSELYDYPVIDPSLEASAPPVTTHTGTFLAETSGTYRPKRAYDQASPLSCISDTPRSSGTPLGRSSTPNPRDTSSNTAKRIKIDDLLSGGSRNGLPLTPPSGDQVTQPTSTMMYTELYKNKYAPSLDALLETEWFRSRDLNKVGRLSPFGELLESLFTRFQSRSGEYRCEKDHRLGNYFSGDAEVILDSIRLVYGTTAPIRGKRTQPVEQSDDYVSAMGISNRNETLKRIAVVEALITEQTDIFSPQVSPKSSPVQFEGHHIEECFKFWRSLSRFISMKEGKDPEQEFGYVLGEMKNNIQNRRNRMVLYHIAQARHYYNRAQNLSRPEALDDSKRSMGLFNDAKLFIDNTVRAPNTQRFSEEDIILRRISARALILWGTPFPENTFIL